MHLPLFKEGIATEYLTVSDKESIEATRNLAKYEGVFAGFSSGANVAAAIKLLRNTEKNKSIALAINDTGLKYLSTELYEV